MSDFLFDHRVAYGAPDFSRFEIDKILSSAEEALSRAKKRFADIIENEELPTFENTILALNHHDREMEYVGAIYGFISKAEMTDELGKIGEKFEEMQSHYSTGILTSAALFERIKFLHDHLDQLKLEPQELATLERKFQSFSENGALLNDQDKETLKEINVRLAVVRKTYLKNMTDAVKKAFIPIEDEATLNGLPESFKQNAAKKASDLNLNVPYAITLDTPTFLAAMNNCTNRELRQLLNETRDWITQNGEHDNRPVALEIIQLRHARAKLLGAENHMAYILPNRMVNTPEKAWDFVNKLIASSSIAEKNEIEDLTALAREQDGLETLEPWDIRYYMNQKSKAEGLDEEKLRAYFEVDHVVNSTLSHLGRLFSLEFKRSDDYPVSHDDIQVFEMRTDPAQETPSAIFYLDLYKREGKKAGAWENAILSRSLLADGSTQIPLVTINTNYVRATDNQPTYIRLDDYITLHHEMGHGLHEALTEINYDDIASSQVPWDFVELPSMAIEKFAMQPDILRISTRHKETGEPMPEEMMTEINKRGEEFPGIFLKRQAYLSLIDLHFYSTDPAEIESIDAVEKEVQQFIGGLSYERSTSHRFHHIFSGGYSSGYYSYFWADVLATDAFNQFKNGGLYNPDIAESFRKNILAKGASEPAHELYRAFSGSDPDINLLLRELKLPEIQKDEAEQSAKPDEPSLTP